MPLLQKAGQPRTSDDSGVGIGMLVGVSVLWLPLSMLFNSLQSIVLPIEVLRFVPATGKATALGWMLFIGLAVGAMIQPVAGAVSDRLVGNERVLGRRGPPILVGLVLVMVFLTGFALASNLWSLAIMYVGLNIAAGILQAGSQGLLPDRIPVHQRGSASGLKGLLELVGSVLGFTIAGMLLKHGNFIGIAVAIGVALVAGALLTRALLRAGKRNGIAPAQREAATNVLPSMRAGPVSTLAQQSAHHEPTVRHAGVTLTRVLLSRFLFLFGVYGVGHFLLFYVRDRLRLGSGAASTTSGLFTLLTVLTAVIALSGGIFSDRFGRLPILWASAAFSAAGVLILIPADALSLVIVGGAVMSIGSGLFASANWALAADLAPAGQGGQFFGLVALSTGGAMAAAGLLGPLVDHEGYTALFVVAALAFCVGAALLPRVAHALPAPQAREALTA